MLYPSSITSAIFQWFENKNKLIQSLNFLNHKNPLNLSPNLSCTSFSPSDFHEDNYTKDPIQSHGHAPSSALSMNGIIHPPIRQHHTSSRTASPLHRGCHHLNGDVALNLAPAVITKAAIEHLASSPIRYPD
jgi:hypothetical protein